MPPPHCYPLADPCPGGDCPNHRFKRKRDVYWGHSKPDSHARRTVTHTGKFPLTYFEGTALTARAIRVRFLTGHAPAGECRDWFHPDNPLHWDRWVGGLQTRLHIVEDCSWFDLTSPDRFPFRLFTESLDPFPLMYLSRNGFAPSPAPSPLRGVTPRTTTPAAPATLPGSPNLSGTTTNCNSKWCTRPVSSPITPVLNTPRSRGRLPPQLTDGARSLVDSSLGYFTDHLRYHVHSSVSQ